MTALRTAAQQALEALEYHVAPPSAPTWRTTAAITALRAALAQQTLNAPEECEHKADGWYAVQRVAGVTRVWPMTEAQALRAALAQQDKPVAWRYDLEQNGSFAGVSTEYSRIKLDNIGKNWTPLYTAPPQRKLVPLTEEEIEHIGMTHQSLRQVVRAVERAHGIKE